MLEKKNIKIIVTHEQKLSEKFSTRNFCYYCITFFNSITTGICSHLKTHTHNNDDSL